MTKNVSIGDGGLKIYLDPHPTLKKFWSRGWGSKNILDPHPLHKNSMVHHPCSIIFQNDQYLGSFQIILSLKSKRNEKTFVLGVGF